MLTNEKVAAAVELVRDMGELIYFPTVSGLEDVVVVDPKWFGTNVVGRLLAPASFPALNRPAVQAGGRVTVEEVARVLKMDLQIGNDVLQVLCMLQGLGICHRDATPEPVLIVDGRYSVSIAAMTQTNTETGFDRSIRRVSSTRWEVDFSSDSSGAWRNCTTPADAARLEAAYTKHTSFTFPALLRNGRPGNVWAAASAKGSAPFCIGRRLSCVAPTAMDDLDTRSRDATLTNAVDIVPPGLFSRLQTRLRALFTGGRLPVNLWCGGASYTHPMSLEEGGKCVDVQMLVELVGGDTPVVTGGISAQAIDLCARCNVDTTETRHAACAAIEHLAGTIKDVTIGVSTSALTLHQYYISTSAISKDPLPQPVDRPVFSEAELAECEGNGQESIMHPTTGIEDHIATIRGRAAVAQVTRSSSEDAAVFTGPRDAPWHWKAQQTVDWPRVALSSHS
jgi:hypothetical protein